MDLATCCQIVRPPLGAVVGQTFVDGLEHLDPVQPPVDVGNDVVGALFLGEELPIGLVIFPSQFHRLAVRLVDRGDGILPDGRIDANLGPGPPLDQVIRQKSDQQQGHRRHGPRLLVADDTVADDLAGNEICRQLSQAERL